MEKFCIDGGKSDIFRFATVNNTNILRYFQSMLLSSHPLQIWIYLLFEYFFIHANISNIPRARYNTHHYSPQTPNLNVFTISLLYFHHIYIQFSSNKRTHCSNQHEKFHSFILVNDASSFSTLSFEAQNIPRSIVHDLLEISISLARSSPAKLQSPPTPKSVPS